MSDHSQSAYIGHENLLVMQNAHNYNRYLGSLIRKYGEKSRFIVDFGAGIGALAQETRLWAQKLVCVEPDKVQADILSHSGYTVYDDVANIPESGIDFVYSVNVMEHIEDDQKVMSDIFSVIQQGGRLLIYVPAMPWLYSRMDDAVGHYRRYSMNELKRKTTLSGFKIIRCEYADSLGVLATLAYKVFGSSSGKLGIGSLKIYDTYFFPISRLLDGLFNQICGKNLLIICEKP